MVKPTKVTNSMRSFRFAHGEMTQAELADRVGVTRQTIIAIEQGKYSPSLEMAFRIAWVRTIGIPHRCPKAVPSLWALPPRVYRLLMS